MQKTTLLNYTVNYLLYRVQNKKNNEMKNKQVQH